MFPQLLWAIPIIQAKPLSVHMFQVHVTTYRCSFDNYIISCEHADSFYETQKAETKVVANAYMHVGSRVKNVKRRFNDLIPILKEISPLHLQIQTLNCQVKMTIQVEFVEKPFHYQITLRPPKIQTSLLIVNVLVSEVSSTLYVMFEIFMCYLRDMRSLDSSVV
jgi:hypothetical protein